MKISGKFGDIKNIIEIVMRGATLETVIVSDGKFKGIEVSRTIYKEVVPSSVKIEGDDVMGIGANDLLTYADAIFNASEDVVIESTNDSIKISSSLSVINIPNRDISSIILPPNDFVKIEDGKGYISGEELETRVIVQTKVIDKIVSAIKKLKRGSAICEIKGPTMTVRVGDEIRGSVSAEMKFSVESTKDVTFDLSASGYNAMITPADFDIIFMNPTTVLVMVSNTNVGRVMAAIAPRVKA